MARRNFSLHFFGGNIHVFVQGAGTAIGELPPYFMARAARLSGAEPDDEDYEEFEEMLEQAESAQVRNVFNMTHKHCTAKKT